MKKFLIVLSLLLILQNVFAAPWDLFRIPISVANILNPIFMGLFLLVAFIILVISCLAFKKKKSQRLMFVTIAFGLFFIKSVLGMMDIYVSPGIFMNFAVQGVFDLSIMLAFVIALFRK